MALTTTQAIWFLPFVLPICLWTAWSDLKFMKIPNKAVMSLFVVFALIGLLALPLADYGWRYVQLVAVLVAGFLLNMIGALGAGDAKFAAVMAAFVPLADVRAFLVLFAVVLLAAFVTHRMFRAMPSLRAAVGDWKSWHVRDFPMGLALGSVLAFYLILGAIQSA